MGQHSAKISWHRNGVEFTDQRYSRAHEWHFDGGARVEASASPANVPEPYSVPAAIDPEEALIAATSSCHMLWFLALAAGRGILVDSYIDEATGLLGEDQPGRHAFTRITLNPQISFSGTQPSAGEIAALHGEAHANCFIANSLRCEVVDADV